MRNNAFERRFVSIVLIVMVALASGLLFGMQKDEVFAAKKAKAENSVEHGKGGIDESAPAPSVSKRSSQSKLKLQAGLPGKYDSRDKGYITPVRNQDALNVCWSFAAIGAVESSLLAHEPGLSARDLDLSERQLAYFTFNLQPDALGNTKGDKTIPLRSNYLDNYGNTWLTTETMISGIGVADEKDVPTYQDILSKWRKAGYRWTKNFGNETKLDPGLARGANTWRLSSAKRIPTTDRDSIKQAIMDNGSVAVLTYLDEWDFENVLWNEEKSAYYNFGWDESNHLVTIVGWDDSYPRLNFTYYDEDWDDEEDYLEDAPEHDGAWLCRNSWGKGWGNKGYYWVSYDDCYFNKDYVSAYAYEMKKASGSEILYQYDGSASDAYLEIPSGGSVANKFKVKGASGKDEILKSVSLSLLYDTDVSYSIQIYKDCASADDPTSGTPALASPKTGTTTCAGIYDIDLDEEVTLAAGSTFAVVVRLSKSNGDSVKYDVDATYDIEDFVGFRSKVSRNQSFKKTGSSASWIDLYDEMNDPKEDEDAEKWTRKGCAARIKAVTLAKGAKPYPARTSVSSAKVKVKNVTYNGKVQKPSVTVTLSGKKLKAGRDFIASCENNTNVGKAKVVITGIGKYKGAKRAAYKINPKGTGLKKPAAGKKKITVKWKKQTAKMRTSKITGYQVQYSTSKNFKKGKKSINVKGTSKSKRVIKKLKSGKKYYIRIRTYKTVSKAKYYSPWSKKKSVKVK